MIARRKPTFLFLVSLLRKIAADKNDLESVKGLNFMLVKSIMDDEKCIRHYREHAKELNRQLKKDRPTKEQSKALRKKLEACKRIEAKYFEQIYIWRCFGDALAYTYISSVNMRQVLFNTEDYGVKRDAGFISGKEGFVDEFNMLLSALEHKVPAVLCDITNTVRYGDVCLLGADAPCPVEAKKGSAANNQRGKRQAAKLARLHDYLESDVATDFRGQPHSERITMDSDFVTCAEQLNLCIKSAYPDGYSIVCPERGLIYAATVGDFDSTALINNTGMESFFLAMVNDAKSNQTWAPFQPFLNLIRRPEHLFDFVIGRLKLFVVVDIGYLLDCLSMPDWTVSPIQHPQMMILFEHESGANVGSSTQMFNRFVFEFMSMKWYVKEQQLLAKTVLDRMTAGQGAIIESEFLEDLERTLKGAPRLFD